MSSKLSRSRKWRIFEGSIASYYVNKSHMRIWFEILVTWVCVLYSSPTHPTLFFFFFKTFRSFNVCYCPAGFLIGYLSHRGRVSAAQQTTVDGTKEDEVVEEEVYEDHSQGNPSVLYWSDLKPMLDKRIELLNFETSIKYVPVKVGFNLVYLNLASGLFLMNIFNCFERMHIFAGKPGSHCCDFSHMTCHATLTAMEQF